MEKKIRGLHILRLSLRGILFAAAVAVYFINKEHLTGVIEFGKNPLYIAIWFFFMTDMIIRFFPFPYESMGSRKAFACTFVPDVGTAAPSGETLRRNRRAVAVVASVWVALNGVIGALHLAGIIDRAAMLLVSLFYSVCDIICILFWCPFRALFMKNRCCVNCRIYNWDFAMMFTPMLFVRTSYTLSLFAVAIVLLARWEITYILHPERFTEETNCALRCINCQEHQCRRERAARRLARKTRRNDP